MDKRILRKRDRGSDHEEWSFWCPACKTGHAFVVKWGTELAAKMKEGKFGTPTWTFDGNQDAPTFNPSLLIREYMSDKVVLVCHSFVKAGKIEYCGDCTHELKGKSIPMEPF